jgi:hypothetical protein
VELDLPDGAGDGDAFGVAEVAAARRDEVEAVALVF